MHWFPFLLHGWKGQGRRARGKKKKKTNTYVSNGNFGYIFRNCKDHLLPETTTTLSTLQSHSLLVLQQVPQYTQQGKAEASMLLTEYLHQQISSAFANGFWKKEKTNLAVQFTSSTLQSIVKWQQTSCSSAHVFDYSIISLENNKCKEKRSNNMTRTLTADPGDASEYHSAASMLATHTHPH